MTGSEMAKAGLREQNRLSGANRNTLIAGGIMANTAEIFNFPVPDAAQKEPRVADLDDGYTRIANELLEAVMLAGYSTSFWSSWLSCAKHMALIKNWIG